MEKKKIFLILLLLSLLLIYKTNIKEVKVYPINEIKEVKVENKSIEIKPLTNKSDNIIGSIRIPSINLKENLFNIESAENNVDKNIEILPTSSLPSDDGSHLMIVGHSGYGRLAYFKNLDKVKINDFVHISINNEEYKYQIYKMEEISKRKTSYVKNKENIISLFTCSYKEKDKFLVLKGILVKP